MSNEATEIRDLLHRRTDLSTFVVHFTRYWEDRDSETNEIVSVRTPDNNLVSILADASISARSSYGIARNKDLEYEWREQSQHVVCFSETPLEHAKSMLGKIANRGWSRDAELSPYGLAFSKLQARRLGVNPVWYLDQTPSGHDWLGNVVDRLVESAGKDFPTSDISRLTPFMEVMGTWDSRQKEFWWEREWRHAGNFPYGIDQVAVGFCPEGEIEAFEKLAATKAGATGAARYPRFVDPSWGLERMLAHLAGLAGKDVDPFATS